MKNKAALVILASLIVVGCASNSKTENTGLGAEDVAPDCVHRDAPNKAAPLWVCTGNMPGSGYELSAVGFAEKATDGGAVRVLERRAVAAAQLELAQMLSVHVSDMFKEYVTTTGRDDFYTEEQFTESFTKTITDQTLKGARVYYKNLSPEGGMYALMGLDSAAVEEASKQVLQTSMNNERALWSKFLADKAQEELAQEILRMNESAN